MKNKIYLIGSMGSGKSTIGRLLAKQMNLPFFDIDKMIVDQEKMSITDIFSKYSEEYFREIESNILEKNSHEGNFVTSTGGGCILRQQNIKILKQGLVVYLKISVDAQYERVKNRTHRPLLNGGVTKEDLARLDDERGSIYSDISNIEVDVSNFNKEDVLSSIIKELKGSREKINLKVNGIKIPIIIGREIFKSVNVAEYVAKNDVVIVTNSTIAKLYLKQTKRLFREFNVSSLVLPDGEKYKNIQTIQKIYDYLIKNKLDRSVTIVALGGGVIGDMVAFAADTFLRGVDLIHIPTTLLAQVDSSIGGKCGINHPLGKNLIGSFKHPRAVIMDTAILKTLPKREFMAGMAEVIKYGLIKNKSFFNFIDNNYSRIIKQDYDSLIKTIFTCASIKSQVVKEDELEGGVRAILNFGHTFGHAIEASKNYKGILHGEAISIGMNIASAISADQGYLTHDEYCNIEDMLLNMRMPTMIPKKLQ